MLAKVITTLYQLMRIISGAGFKRRNYGKLKKKNVKFQLKIRKSQLLYNAVHSTQGHLK